MSAAAPRTQLVCDQKWRDLPNLAALALALERRGHRVRISTTKDVTQTIRMFRPDCVVLNHLFAPANQQLAHRLRAAGIAVVVLPTEGAVRPELQPIADGEFAERFELDLYLAWSPAAADGIKRRWGFGDDVVRTIGCTRFDFYTPAFAAAVTSRAAFCAQYGLDAARPIVTWATNHAYAEVPDRPDLIERYIAEGSRNGLIECHRRIGRDPLHMPRMHKAGRTICSAAIFGLAAARPDWQFIVRPHPVEPRAFYLAEIERRGLHNVRFAPQDYIWNVLAASDLHLHRQCTTAVEAWMWDKPTIELTMAEELDWADREVGSDAAPDEASLTELADRYIGGARVAATRIAYRRRYIEKWFGASHGEFCAAAAVEIDALVRGRAATARPVRTETFAPFGDAVAARLRYALGLAPGVSLLGRGRAAVATAMDKEVTRKDIGAYRGLLAATDFGRAA